jgi:hypothetical protein
MLEEGDINRHNKCAPYWAILMIVLLLTGLSTIWFKIGNFWNGYVLDMVGPAWSYILIRGLYTAKADNKWTRFFSSTKTLIILLIVAFGIETLQYFKVYHSTFDPLDIIAYTSVIVPIYIIEQLQARGGMLRIHKVK